MEYKPNAYERDVLDTFKKVVGETGYLKEFYFEEHDCGCGGMSIVKQAGKWTSYVYEKGSRIGQRWYDDVYDLVVDAFQTLSKSATDYCVDHFPSKMYFEIREDVRVNKKYKLYGTMNMLDVVPGFVYPVFHIFHASLIILRFCNLHPRPPPAIRPKLRLPGSRRQDERTNCRARRRASV